MIPAIVRVDLCDSGHCQGGFVIPAIQGGFV